MGKLRRLDAEIVRRKLAPSRTQAARLIEENRVLVDGQIANKAARQINPAQAIVIKENEQGDFASRGGYKLSGVLDLLGEKSPAISDRICLDAGASTGGFTDVLLRRGAKRVHAVDVGYGQLRWELQQNPKVIVHDRTNVRTLTPQQLGESADLIVSDLSFISLELVIPALVKSSASLAEMLLMVKPQFEIGKERLGAGGVVRNLDDHAETVSNVINCAKKHGLALLAVEASPLPGPSGNVEYFIHLRHNGPSAEKNPAEQGRSLTMEPKLDWQKVLLAKSEIEEIESAVWGAINRGPAKNPS